MSNFEVMFGSVVLMGIDDLSFGGVAAYVEKCVAAGSDDDIRNCANRYLAGKRKVTAPGTRRKSTS